MTNSGGRILIQITFDVMNVLSTSALKHRGVTIIFNYDYDASFSKRDSEFGVSRLSCLLTHHSGEWNPISQSDGDGRKRMRQTTWPDSLIFLVQRKLQDHYVLLNHRQMLREWHTTRHTFHSEMGARSVLRVVDEVLRTDELW